MPRLRKTQSSTTTAHSSSTTPATSSVYQRKKLPVVAAAQEKADVKITTSSDGPEDDLNMSSWTARNRWIVFAIASGACAAFNGVFAKLTTNDLSTHIAQGISGFFGLTDLEKIVEVVVRSTFFGLNLLFNGIMWSLFTQALAKGQSTTQVSIMNTSTNFMITALLGLAIFAEALPPLWWVGAAMLVAGNVIIGRETKEESAATEAGAGAGSDEVEFRDANDDGDDCNNGDGNDDYEHNHSHGHDDVSTAERGCGSAAAPQEEGILPVEKDNEDEDEDEDVPLLGNLS